MFPYINPLRDKQQDPWTPCRICGCEVYGLATSLFDSVTCEQCAEGKEEEDDEA